MRVVWVYNYSMSSITKFTLKDVRCFEGEQFLDIRPITLLVGENSTGKSTVLGCYHALFESFERGSVDFNSEPYEMGAFDDIFRKGNKQKSFSLSVDYEYKRKINTCQVEFKESGPEPIVEKIKYNFASGGSIIFICSESSNPRHPICRLVDIGKNENSFTIAVSSRALFNLDLINELPVWMEFNKKEFNRKFFNFLMDKIYGKKFYSFYRKVAPAEKVISMGPVRSRPKRVYTPTIATPTPEGGEVPMLMMRINRTDENAWDKLAENLNEFGENSEMFKDIKIKKLGSKMGDPFELQVKIAKYHINIMNVGYGVSQVLPILVRMINEIETGIFARLLIQQPEVHLHPRAQSALGSLLVEFAEKKKQKYLIETHSDYIIDRIRIEIREGKISPDKVSLVYHELKGGKVKLHNIKFDNMGNLLDVPAGYREFFMEQTKKLLGF